MAKMKYFDGKQWVTFDADTLNGKSANNTADNIPVLDSNGKILSTQIPSHGTHVPSGGTNTKYLRGDGVWETPPDTKYTHPDDSNTRHVTDAEKSAWNAKETTSGAQTKATAALNSAKTYTDEKVSQLVNSAPETLDTLKELSDALGNDPNFATTVANQIGLKSDKTYVDTELAKKANSSHGTHVTYEGTVGNIKAPGTASVGTLNTIARADHVHPAQTSVSGNAGTATKLAAPVTINGVSFDGSKNITVTATDNTKVSPTGTIVANRIAVFNDTTGKVIKDSGYTIATSVPSGAKFTDTVYTHPSNHPASVITQDANNRFVTDTEKSTWNAKSDKTYVDAELAKKSNTHSHPYAASSHTDQIASATVLGHIKSGGDITISTEGIVSVNDNSHNHTNYSPTGHNHDDRYYTETEINSKLNEKANVSHGNHVPTVETANNAKFLRNDNTWQTVTPANIGAAAASHGTHVSYSTVTSALTNGGTGIVGTSSKLAREDHTHTLPAYPTLSSLGALAANANAVSATKLQTARSIEISGGAIGTATSFDGTKNINIPITSMKESYMSWGGKDFAGSYGCIDAAMIPNLGANRFAFMNGNAVTVEYSRDGGATWLDYGASANSKKALFSTSASFSVGKSDANNIPTSGYQLRITINTGVGQVYTELNKFCIYVSTNGSSGSTCTIEKALESTPTTFVTEKSNVPVSGWSGYNIINTSSITTYGNSSASQYGRLRFTFKITGQDAKYTGLQVMRIYGFGGVGWTTPSTMASNGSLFSYNENQEATFPAKITAPSFSGSLSGNASSATKLLTARTINGVSFDGTQNITVTDSTKVSPTGTIVANRIATFNDTTGKVIKDSGYTIATSVPSGAKFTDTTYAAGTALTLSGTTFNVNLGTGSNQAAPGNHTHAYDNYGGWNIKTSGNSAAYKLTSNGTATFKGGSATSVTHDSSGNVTISSPVYVPSISANTGSTAGWYRIASSPESITNCTGTFYIKSEVSGNHSLSVISASTSYGVSPVIQQISHSPYSGTGITKVRIVYHTSYSGNYAYLEVYNPNAKAISINVKMVGGYGWSLISPSTVGSIPSGYTNKEIQLISGGIQTNVIASTTQPPGYLNGRVWIHTY